MSEFADSFEDLPTIHHLSSAGEKLLTKLHSTGSLEQLILSIQHDYTGDQHPAERPIATSSVILSDMQETPTVLTEVLYEKSAGTADLYRLNRIAHYISEASGHSVIPTSESAKALYAGELVAMATIDSAPSEDSGVSQKMLLALDTIRRVHTDRLLSSKNKHRRHMGLSNSIIHTITYEERTAIHRQVVDGILKDAYEFSLKEGDIHSSARELIQSLLQGIPIEKATYIETGYWLVMQQWLEPKDDDHAPELDDTVEVHQAVDSLPLLNTLAQKALSLVKSDGLPVYNQTLEKTVVDRKISDLELEFAHNEIEYGASEWDRKPLDKLVKRLLQQTLFFKAAAPLQGIDINNEDNKAIFTNNLVLGLNKLAKEQFELDSDDILFAHGTFVAYSESKPSTWYAYQNLSKEDGVPTKPSESHTLTPYEIRGTFCEIEVVTALSDTDSYSLNIDDTSYLDDATFEHYVPAISLENVSIINMNDGVPIEQIKKMVIPLTHSHLKLGRFIPPQPESE